MRPLQSLTLRMTPQENGDRYLSPVGLHMDVILQRIIFNVELSTAAPLPSSVAKQPLVCHQLYGAQPRAVVSGFRVQLDTL
jgi:hypothetical protein